MNIVELECPINIEARTSKYNGKTNVVYSIVESHHNLCIDKKEIMRAQIKACENLRHTSEEIDIPTINMEIKELKQHLYVLN